MRARSAFRLKGSSVPRNGRAIYLRDRQGCRTSPGRRSLGQERGRPASRTVKHAAQSILAPESLTA